LPGNADEPDTQCHMARSIIVMELTGKVAVITGGASGIGLETARRLAARGARLVLADIEHNALLRAVDELSVATETIGVVTDVSDKGSVDALAATVETRFGGPDIVFLNAGVSVHGPTVEMTHDDWRWVVGVNLWGPIHGVEAFVPAMVERGRGGHLLFTASFAGLVPNVGLGVYCVTKYGVVALAETLKRELAPSGIGVSVLCPMLVATNIKTSERNRPDGLGGPDTRHRLDTEDGSMVGRTLPVEQIADQVMAAIGTDRLYIVPHEESRRSIQRRFERIDAAFE
jgi:NAD(P)-dependent dehydrogenase (short-subunit alcohol dehydrogenase family)